MGSEDSFPAGIFTLAEGEKDAVLWDPNYVIGVGSSHWWPWVRNNTLYSCLQEWLFDGSVVFFLYLLPPRDVPSGSCPWRVKPEGVDQKND